jgi:hypothetical protein
MADPKNTASSRLTQITDFLTMNKTATTIPWDPDSTKFPTRQELPEIPGAPKEAAWVWGHDDYVCYYGSFEILCCGEDRIHTLPPKILRSACPGWKASKYRWSIFDRLAVIFRDLLDRLNYTASYRHACILGCTCLRWIDWSTESSYADACSCCSSGD